MLSDGIFDDEFRFTVRPDAPDPEGRPDRPFAPATTAPVDDVGYEWYRRHAVSPTWRQRGSECTGFALAAAVTYLVRSRGLDTSPPISPRMMYEMAQEYDEAAWETGSTLRGALIGWQRRGATTADLWPYAADDEDGTIHGRATLGRLNDGRSRQLPAADYTRIEPADIDLMKAALAEHKVLYVYAHIHTGWFRPYLPDPDDDTKNLTLIERLPGDRPKGAHAFLIVGADSDGFWVHNSWGSRWGDEGYAVLSYDDWNAPGEHEGGGGVWVLDLDERIDFPKPLAQDVVAARNATVPIDRRRANAAMMWRHLVILGDDGRPCSTDDYEFDADVMKNVFYAFKQASKDWHRPRLVIFGDDGSRPLDATADELAALRRRLMDAEIYPVFVVWDVPWHADLDDELTLFMGTAEEREAVDIGTPDEPDLVDISYWLYEYQIPQGLAVMMWRALRDRARRAATSDGGGLRSLAERIRYRYDDRPFDLHLVGHGVGDFTLSELVGLLDVPVTSCDLWAPASTFDEFERTYGLRLDDGRLQQMTITVLDDESERADRIGNYEESILCLASNVLSVPGVDSPTRFHYGPRSEAPPPAAGAAEQEAWRRHVQVDPVPIVGLQRWLDSGSIVARRAGRVGTETVTGLTHSELARDPGVLAATIGRILAAPPNRRATSPTSPWPSPTTPQRPLVDPRDPLAAARRAVERRRAAVTNVQAGAAVGDDHGAGTLRAGMPADGTITDPIERARRRVGIGREPTDPLLRARRGVPAA